MSQRDLRKSGAHVGGLPVSLMFPASVVYTRPSHLQVKDGPVLPLYLLDTFKAEYPDREVTIVREEYEVAERGRRY